nr:magnesium transporter CorA family protein [Peptoclostridium acidaminophilum]
MEDKLVRIEDIAANEKDIWLNLVNPSQADIAQIAEQFGIDMDHIRAALDEEERARIEVEDNYTLIIIDIPVLEKEDVPNYYITIPLGIIMGKDFIITVCIKDSPIMSIFENGRIKGFNTFMKTRFAFQIFYKTSALYLNYLRRIDRKSNDVERELHKSMKNKELIQLLNLEKSLVYFTTSLRANEIVMEKMLRHDSIKKYPEDKELLEDVIIENKQAIEMASIYSNILSGMMDAFASVISNNLNIVMKFLTSVTIVMAIPTMVASFFGMNVNLPFSDKPYAFSIVLLISFCLSLLFGTIMARKKMF